MNLKETNSSRLSFGENVVLVLMIVIVAFSLGYLKADNDSLQRQVDQLEARETYGLFAPKNPWLAPRIPETATPPTSSNPTSRSVKLNEGMTVYEALYDIAFSKGYPEYIYSDGDEQRRESLKLINQWMEQIRQQIAAGPVCVNNLPCITDIDVVPVGTVVEVSYRYNRAAISPGLLSSFFN